MAKQHKLIEALGNRAFYADKIRDLQKIIENDAKFDAFTIYELNAKKVRVQQLFDNFEIKCMDVKCIDGEAETSAEDEELESICNAMKEKIDRKLEALKMADKKQSLPIGLEHYTIPRKVEPQSEAMQTVSVPSPEIEAFKGELNKWFKFRKEFETKIHNQFTTMKARNSHC